MSNTSQNSDFVPLETLTGAAPSERFWRSVDEFAGTSQIEQLLETEFPENAEEGPQGDSRRRFLSLMAGSMALAGLTGCTRQPTEMIMPYVDPPEHAIPGKPQYYATAVPVNGIAEGVIVESHLGRPTKVEGNPDHPGSLGASSVSSQACLMDLYDPDRAKSVLNLGETADWNSFLQAFGKALGPIRNRGGQGFHLLTETIVSPTLGAQIQAVLKAMPAAKWHQFDPAGAHSVRAGAQMAFGRPVNTIYKFTNADVVLALDSDFLAAGPGATRYARDFANRRRRGNRLDMNRLYAVESSMTSTGGKADHRLPVRYADVEAFARDIAAQAGVAGVSAAGVSSLTRFANATAKDLQAHRGASIVIAGEHQSPSVHALAHAINAALGNVGKTVIYTEALELSAVDQVQSLRDLMQAMDSGSVELLLILGGNPSYNAPADFAFDEHLKKIAMSVHAGLHVDETSAHCTWHTPESHFLEEWGDVRGIDGTVTIQQPLISPLYNSHSHLQLLDSILQFPGRSAHDIVRAYWTDHSGATDFEQWWRKSVHDGLVARSMLPAITPALNPTWSERVEAAPAQEIEVVFRPDVYLHDGRYANNVWLQELPRPMTKLTWDNAVHLSPATAKRLNLENQQNVRLEYRSRSVEGSVWVSPGHPDNSITIHLGYGRWQSGRAGNGAGFNAYAVRTSDALWSGSGAKLTPTGKTYPLATTQMQQGMVGRNLIISKTVDGYKQEPDFVSEIAPEPQDNLTLYPHWQYKGYAWAMSIDLTACVNCNACVIACQAENNIAVVGKEQVLARRAMHWIRIDTYYQGNLDNPAAYYQPVPCMQCENAPCELVCPVQATNHSSDGLNDMVYNRCVGTRYCSNNCPYKVRRFNFFLYSDWKTDTWKMQKNPDVTVRSRGVMEKCTYCVQRIREAEIRSQVENRFIRDGEIQTACQQACPTQAIVFGDKNNKDNRVAQLKAEKLDYSLLAELNTRPRTTYLAELRNPNPELEKGAPG